MKGKQTMDPESATQTKVDEGEFDYDFTEEEGGRVLPGDYPARLMAIEDGFTKTKGEPKLEWKFQLWKDGEAWDGFTPRPLVTVKNPNAMWKYREVLSALGIGQSGQKGRFKAGDVVGSMCVLTLIDDEYQGVISSKIDRVKPHPKGAKGE